MGKKVISDTFSDLNQIPPKPLVIVTLQLEDEEVVELNDDEGGEGNNGEQSIDTRYSPVYTGRPSISEFQAVYQYFYMDIRY